MIYRKLSKCVWIAVMSRNPSPSLCVYRFLSRHATCLCLFCSDSDHYCQQKTAVYVVYLISLISFIYVTVSKLFFLFSWAFTSWTNTRRRLRAPGTIQSRTTTSTTYQISTTTTNGRRTPRLTTSTSFQSSASTPSRTATRWLVRNCW